MWQQADLIRTRASCLFLVPNANPEEMPMRIAHYLNQFFGGIGAEEQAAAPLEIREGAVGPGKLMESC